MTIKTRLSLLRFPLMMPAEMRGSVGGSADDEEPPVVVDDVIDEVIAEDVTMTAEAEEEGEVTVTLGAPRDPGEAVEDDENKAPTWVRDLRKTNRELVRRQRELETENARLKGPPPAEVVGPRPTLSTCDFDEERFDRELETWLSKKSKADEESRKKQEVEQQRQTQWTAKLDAVSTAYKGLKVAGAEDALQAFEDTFSTVQQGIITDGPADAKTAALLRYVLGANPAKAKELAAITNPVKFTFAIAELKAEMKVTPRKTAPVPDAAVRSGLTGAVAMDSVLERLRAEADKTGDRSKVAKFMRDKERAKQAA